MKVEVTASVLDGRTYLGLVIRSESSADWACLEIMAKQKGLNTVHIDQMDGALVIACDPTAD